MSVSANYQLFPVTLGDTFWSQFVSCLLVLNANEIQIIMPRQWLLYAIRDFLQRMAFSSGTHLINLWRLSLIIIVDNLCLKHCFYSQLPWQKATSQPLVCGPLSQRLYFCVEGNWNGQGTWALLEYKDCLSGYMIPIIMIGRSWDSLILIMGISTLLRRRPYF